MIKETSYIGLPIEDTVIICPTCRAIGDKSRVKLVNDFHPIELGVESFWDEQGRRHQHFGGPSIATFECSKGHRFEKIENVRCYCGHDSLSKEWAISFLNRLFDCDVTKLSGNQLLKMHRNAMGEWATQIRVAVNLIS